MDMTIPIRQGELTIPNWAVNMPLLFFFGAIFACWMAYGFVPAMDLWMIACLSIILFFYGGSSIAKGWSRTTSYTFIKRVFVVGAIVRFLWVIYVYFVFNPNHFANTFGETADVEWYMPFAKDLAQWMAGNSDLTLPQIIKYHGSAIDDVGYPMWLGVIYLIVGVENDVFAPFLLKCIMGAYCSVNMYHVAKRHYGEGVARIAAIFVCLNPNMIYWCGSMFKEAEMVFLVCLAVDNLDRVLSSGKKYTFRNLLPGMLAAIALMFFRSALGMVIFLAVFAHVIMASQRVMSTGKKVLAGLLVAAVLAVSMGDRIRSQAQEFTEFVKSDKQNVNMEWRAKRKGGNEFAKYAGAAVFAPLIFTIPFPTFNQANEAQLIQVQLSGGYYIKNVTSFFVILVMFMFLISGEWRRHVFILAYTVGYLMVLVMSNFAQSGRFHMPVIPMLTRAFFNASTEASRQMISTLEIFGVPGSCSFCTWMTAGSFSV
jgi:hypothetical protein